MILLAVPEMVATLQLLKRAKGNGCLWQVFWRGEISPSASQEKPISRNATSSFGFTLPWNLVILALLGGWMICSPFVFHSMHPASDSNYVAGPLLIAFSIISFSEPLRNLRWGNFLIALGLVFSSLFLKGFSGLGFANQLIASVLIFALTIPRGKKHERYGEESSTFKR
jgi:hypothetical protein